MYQNKIYFSYLKNIAYNLSFDYQYFIKKIYEKSCSTGYILRNFYFISALLIFNALLSSCSSNKQEKNDETALHEEHHEEQTNLTLSPTQYKSIGIKLEKVQKRNLRNSLKVNGIIDTPPQNLLSISAPMSGFVKETNLLQGTYVQKGQVLAILQNMEYVQLQQDYLDKKSQMTFAEAEFERQKALNQENVNAQKVFQQAQATYLSLQAQMAGLAEKLKILGINPQNIQVQQLTSTIQLIAPRNGYVTNIFVNVGKFVSPTDVLFEIVASDGFHIELSVYEKDITQLKEGQKIRYFLANAPSVEKKATIILINKRINEDRTVRVHCHPDTQDDRLLLNTFVTAFIEIKQEDSWSLPVESLLSFEGKSFVFLQIDSTHHTFHLHEVTKGIEYEDFVEITLDDEISTETSIVGQGAYQMLSILKNSEEEGHAH
jgi:cobalt-zinc-cadmium efflux system membrane fusion protein